MKQPHPKIRFLLPFHGAMLPLTDFPTWLVTKWSSLFSVLYIYCSRKPNQVTHMQTNNSHLTIWQRQPGGDESNTSYLIRRLKNVTRHTWWLFKKGTRELSCWRFLEQEAARLRFTTWEWVTMNVNLPEGERSSKALSCKKRKKREIVLKRVDTGRLGIPCGPTCSRLQRD